MSDEKSKDSFIYEVQLNCLLRDVVENQALKMVISYWYATHIHISYRNAVCT